MRNIALIKKCLNPLFIKNDLELIPSKMPKRASLRQRTKNVII